LSKEGIVVLSISSNKEIINGVKIIPTCSTKKIGGVINLHNKDFMSFVGKRSDYLKKIFRNNNI